MTNDEEIIKKLSKVALFNGLNDDQLTTIADLGTYTSKGRNQYIVLENTEGNQIFVLLEGTVDIEVLMPVSHKPNSKTKECIAQLHAGDVLGEMSLFSKNKRSASAKVIKVATYIEFKNNELFDLFIKRNDIGYCIMKNLSSILTSRIEKTNKDLKNRIYQVINPF